MRNVHCLSMCLVLLPAGMVMANPLLGLSATCTEQAADKLLGLPPVPNASAPEHLVEKIQLGKTLFFDKRLSADGSISCASCHNPERGFIDGLPRAQGIHRQLGTRNTPTLVNAVFAETQFWDGRRDSLEAQATDPLFNPIEHALNDEAQLLHVIRQDSHYVAAFERVFATTPETLSVAQVGQAIAAYERTLVAGNSAFDRYLYGYDKAVLATDALRGLELFRGRAQCGQCHVIGENSALFTDQQFHTLGIGFKRLEGRLAPEAVRFAKLSAAERQQLVLSDPALAELGRFSVTLKPTDLGRFRTPSLRNVAETAPYMHDGSIATLEEAVDLEVYYRSVETGRPLILTPLEKTDLVAFLKTLTSPHFQQKAACESAHTQQNRG
ncbi:cytochrome-c peroxidase [Pseudomonas sp. GW456-L14]|uniref:cytochrome-c peroxidase n=1 Tax=unclassified Pseudomonas TaxID=196821 RepID=UPI000C886137|nr:MULTISPECIES: cytochrome c peroxidase [unclassified Pseudomonas]PMY41452.1 cytochrome-c peroxidase [Pseudomonas sp. GW456-L14]PMY54761.1 cytochrome-c peroxidase [Pseudomonas sp. GW456-L12]